MLKRHFGKLVGVLVLLAAVAYLAAGPFLALLKLRSGVEARDAAQVAECVDFPALRSSLKQQLQAVVTQQAKPALENNPFGALGAVFAAKLADGLVEKLVTPEGLSKLLAGQQAVAGLQGVTAPSAPTKKPLEGARFSYESLDRFAVSVPTDGGEETKFILTRSGLEWKLSGLELAAAK